MAAFVRNFPARTCIQVAKLPLSALVEIEAIATVDEVITEFSDQFPNTLYHKNTTKL